jgi:hypothetical protein
MNLIIGKDLTVDSRTIADGCGIKHESAIRLLKEQIGPIESELGTVRFEIQPPSPPQRLPSAATATAREEWSVLHLHDQSHQSRPK